MLKRTLVIFAILTAFLSYSQTHANAQTIRMPLKFRLNLIEVKITVNGVPKIFVLDTGATKTVIDTKTAEELGLSVIDTVEITILTHKARGLLVEVESIGIDSLLVRDLECAAVNFEEVGQLLGGDVSGMLGFDFLSNFKISIDYCNKEIFFDRCYVSPETAICTGDSAIVLEFGTIRMQDKFWECTTETPHHQIKMVFYDTRFTGIAGTVQIQDHEIFGVSLESVESQFIPQLESQIEGYNSLSGSMKKLGGKEIYILEYLGKQEGTNLRFKHIFINVKGKLFQRQLFCT